MMRISIGVDGAVDSSLNYEERVASLNQTSNIGVKTSGYVDKSMNKECMSGSKEATEKSGKDVVDTVTLSSEEKEKLLAQLKEQFKNTKLEIDFNEKVNRFSISVIDKDSKKVIKEIPSEDTLKILEHTRELVGLLMDEKR